MAELLSAEEKNALQEAYDSARAAGREVTRAVFPSVSQLDPARAAEIENGIRRWLEAVSRELSVPLRAAIAARPPVPTPVSPDGVVEAGEAVFWAQMEGEPEGVVALTVPTGFAASMCERVFGASLRPAVERPLTPAEQMLLRDLARGWWGLFAGVWNGVVLRSCDAPEEIGSAEARSSGWLRYTSELGCGPLNGTLGVTFTARTARRLLGELGPSPAELSASSVVGRLGGVPLEISVVLGRAEFALDELASLQVGDVIALDRRSEDPVEIVLESRPFARARAGLAGQRVAFELIHEPIEEPVP